MKRDRASELRAIADGRLMLNVRNGVTVARSMLAMIADEFETMSTALAAKDAELAAVHQRYVDANEARIDAEAALAEPAGEAEPDFAASIAEVIKEESLNEAACGWRPCTGCHETNEGYETGRYPYSAMFGCHVGHGCSECGGLGVVWEYWSKDTLDGMARDVTTPPDASAIREALERLLAIAEKQKAYHNTKQHEFPSIEQCVDEDGKFSPASNLYKLLQGETYNGRYTEADWWVCTIRAEIAALAGAKP